MEGLPGEASRSGRRRAGARFASYAIGIGIAIAVYLPGLPGQFVYDDQRLIVDNEGLRRPLDIRRAFLRDYYASDVDRMGLGYYRPIAILSNELDFRRGNGSPLPFHRTNLWLHAACTALVVALARRCAGGGDLGPAIAGTLFALHPAHAESVAFISGRVDPLATLFGLASILLHLKGVSAARPGRWRAGAALAWLAALLSKEIAITIPALAACAQIARDGFPPRASWRSWVRRYLPYLAVLLPYLALRWTALGSLLGASSDALGARLLQLPVVLGSYLAWLVLPPPGLHLEPAAASGAAALLPVAALVVATCLAVLAWRRERFASAAFLGWCVVALLPVAQIRPLETELSERFLYLPSVGACLAVGALVGGLRSARARAAALVAACFASGAYAGVLVPRVILWRDPVALWSAKAREDPASLKAQLNLGRALAGRGDVEGARRAYAAAAVLAPDMAAMARAEFESLTGAGSGAGMTVEALRKALDATPGDAALWSNLGFRLLEAGDSGGACTAFERAVSIIPTRSNSWFGLALAELRSAHVERAAEAAARSLELNPSQNAARLVLAECALRSGRACAAIRAIEGVSFDAPEEAQAREKILALARPRCAEAP